MSICDSTKMGSLVLNLVSMLRCDYDSSKNQIDMTEACLFVGKCAKQNDRTKDEKKKKAHTHTHLPTVTVFVTFQCKAKILPFQ